MARIKTLLFAVALFATIFVHGASACDCQPCLIMGAGNVSGDNQTALPGAAFAPLVVQVVLWPCKGSPSGVLVSFGIGGGTGTLVSTGVTDANGIAQAFVTAGPTGGRIFVLWEVSDPFFEGDGFFNLTVLSPLNLTSANFLNGAGFFPTDTAGNFSALSPCSIATAVIGTPLTPATLPAVPNLFGVSIQEAIQQPPVASVIFNPDTTPDPAPILNVTGINTAQTLITFQVPCDAIPGPVPVSVALNFDSTPQPVSLAVRSASTGIFELPMSDGVRRAVAVRPDGTFVSLENPAHRGEVIRLYITGIGPTSPPLATNALPTPHLDSHSTAAYLAVQLNGSGIAVLPSSRVSPSLLGVFELDFQIPADAPTGNDVFLEVGVLVTNPGDYQFAQPNVGSKLPIQ